MRRHQLYAAVKALIEASPYLDGVTVVRDDNSITSTATMETALKVKGIVIAVSPILEQRSTNAGGSRSGYATTAQFAVHVRTNPNKNAAMFNLDPDLAVEAVQYALLGAGGGNSGLTFSPAEPATALVPEDAPNLTHVLFFQFPIPVLPPTPAEHVPPAP
jgi:hypothetical protein